MLPETSFSTAEIVLRMSTPSGEDVDRLREGCIHISYLDPFNNAALISKLARQGVDDATLELMCSMLVRSYDPCLSCATHALGRMPLDVTLVDADGNVDVRDVLIGYRSLMGEVTLSPFLSARGDVAPLVGGLPVGDGEFNLGDVLVIQRKALGLVPF